MRSVTNPEFHQTTRLQRAVKMAEIPKPKWHKILVKAIVGIVLLAFALIGVAADWNQWLIVGIVATGAHMVSGQLFLNSVKSIIELVASLVRAVGGKEKDPDA